MSTYRNYLMGGVVDESLPDIDACLEGLDLDKTKFLTWLGYEVGVYRLEHSSANRPPSLREEKQRLSELIKTLDAITVLLQPGGLPPITSALLWETFYKAGFDWDSIADGVYKNATRMKTAGERVMPKLESMEAPRGQPAKASRNALLRALVNQLRDAGANPKDARSRAEKILIACKVPVPAGERAIRRAAKS